MYSGQLGYLHVLHRYERSTPKQNIHELVKTFAVENKEALDALNDMEIK